MIEEYKSLKNFNTFSIDVTARYFTRLSTADALQPLLREYPSPHILGGGSNILLTNNITGLVIYNAIKGIEKIDETPDYIFLKIGAGENWHALVLYCIARNYAGIENLSLIPGTVGAAPIQNIGAYGVELKDVLVCVNTVEIATGKTNIFSNQDCCFGYRDSIFKNRLKNKHIITHVTVRLNKIPVFHTDYGAIHEKLENKPLTIKTISDAVIEIRQQKLPDPKKMPNAGSFFKNPIISYEKFMTLKQCFPSIPHFPEANNEMKIPAAWLIEQCGLKGKRLGRVGVHAQQALVLVNYDNATGNDILQLSHQIQASVLKKFDIELRPEVNIW